MQEWFLLENKITENQWKIAETIYTPFQNDHYLLFWLYPETFRIFFQRKIAEIS